ncbi:hypothetical protein BJ973_000526 [Actinoplanes tereljensis]|uniref:Uncharacterized protein n=1 Tax=Paractinoplanes tereljensis TaxID=571912 RepID=A0A919NQA0_9ACTN|nr:hypothetical protein [Actinoplanes tereljensis]GIF23116.1 hypothetical protein Ate02nite_58460 [Actinoplanes tereljensis]
MTTTKIVPHWGKDADWAGLLLLIVPAGPLPIAVAELARLVRDRIESDAALYDVVTVSHAPSPSWFPAAADWQRGLLVSLVRAAMLDGHFLAPRGIFVTFVVGDSDEEVQRAYSRLRASESFDRLRSISYGGRLGRDSQHGGISAATVEAISQAASKGIAAYEQRPELAIGESLFCAEVDRLIQQGLLSREELQVERPTPPAPVPPSPPAPTRVVPSPAMPTASGLPTAPPRRQPRPPVFHHGDDTVVVDNRSPLSRLRGPAPTDADAIERLSAITDAVSLACFVVVPDEEAGARKAGRDHRAHALGLDRLLATVAGDALTGRRMRVAVEVIAALDPLRKLGVLRPAGELTGGDLPKVPAELFDHGRTVNGLLKAAQSTAIAFQAHGVEVLSLHYIFLSSVALDNANTSGAEWNRLLEHARVTWIEIGPNQPADNPEPLEIAPSPYGFHLVSDRYDVDAMVGEESAILYRYRQPDPESPAPAAPPAAGESADTAAGQRRRWLPRFRLRR